MTTISAAVALYANKESALHAVNSLYEYGFIIKSISAGNESRRSTVVGWSGTMHNDDSAILSNFFKSFISPSSLSFESAMRKAGIPQNTLMKHKLAKNQDYYIVMVYGSKDVMYRGSDILRNSRSLEMDLFKH